MHKGIQTPTNNTHEIEPLNLGGLAYQVGNSVLTADTQVYKISDLLQSQLPSEITDKLAESVQCTNYTLGYLFLDFASFQTFLSMNY